jgi:uncharacterized protein YciI
MFPLALVMLAWSQQTPATPTPPSTAPWIEARPGLPSAPTPPPLLAAPTERPETRTYTLTLLSQGPRWRASTPSEHRSWQEQHAAASQRGLQSGALLAVASVVSGEGDMRTLWLGASSQVADAEALLAGDPAVQAGYLKATVRRALSTASLSRRAAALRAHAGAPGEPSEYQLVLVRQGPRFDPKAELENRQLAMARQVWMDARQQAKQLLLAAPFLDSGDWTGLMLLKAGSLEAARALVADDPTIRTERFAADVYSVMLPKGLLE